MLTAVSRRLMSIRWFSVSNRYMCNFNTKDRESVFKPSQRNYERHLNNITLMGNVASTPDVRSFQDDNRQYGLFNMALHFHNPIKEIDEAFFVSVILRSESLIRLMEKEVQKGDKVYVAGSLVYSHTKPAVIARQVISVVKSRKNMEQMEKNSYEYNNDANDDDDHFDEDENSLNEKNVQ